MKKLFVTKLTAAIFLAFALFFLNGSANAEDMTDFDYNFIDNAFTNPNPTTNKQFEEVMKQYENKEPRGFIYSLKKKFNRHDPKYDMEFRKKYETTDKQPLRIKDAPEAKPTITIGSNFVDSKGKILSPGHYQVDYKQTDEKYTINLLQGNTSVAELKAIIKEDDWQTPAVVYSRLESAGENLVKIVYSNLDITLVSYIRLLK